MSSLVPVLPVLPVPCVNQIFQYLAQILGSKWAIYICESDGQIHMRINTYSKCMSPLLDIHLFKSQVRSRVIPIRVVDQLTWEVFETVALEEPIFPSKNLELTVNGVCYSYENPNTQTVEHIYIYTQSDPTLTTFWYGTQHIAGSTRRICSYTPDVATQDNTTVIYSYPSNLNFAFDDEFENQMMDGGINFDFAGEFAGGFAGEHPLANFDFAGMDMNLIGVPDLGFITEN